MKWIKEFFYISEPKATPEVEEERFEAIKNDDLSIDKFKAESVQTMFMNEIFNYHMQAITAKQKQLKIVIDSLKKSSSKQDELLEIQEQANTVRLIIDKYLVIFRIRTEFLYSEGVKKSVKKVTATKEQLKNAVNAFEQEWLESNDSYNKQLKIYLDELRLKMLKEMQDGGVKDTDYSDLIEKEKDTGREPINPDFDLFSKIML